MKRPKIYFELLLVIVLLFSAIPTTAYADVDKPAFSDVGESFWALPQIERWSGNGIIRGDGDGTFRPNDLITRAELASVLDSVMKFHTVPKSTS